MRPGRSPAPKPPPTNGDRTRTFSSASLNDPASTARTRNGFWVDSKTVSVPPSQWAIVVNGPSGLCVCADVVKVPSTVTSATAMVASASPRFMLVKYTRV